MAQPATRPLFGGQPKQYGFATAKISSDTAYTASLNLHLWKVHVLTCRSMEGRRATRMYRRETELDSVDEKETEEYKDRTHNNLDYEDRVADPCIDPIRV